MNDPIIYRPYKTQIWLLIFTLPIGILAFVGAGYCLHFSGSGAACLLGVGTVILWLSKVLCVSSKTTVIFEENGIRIIGDRRFDYRYIPWEKLVYGRYVKNYKGFQFLVLSYTAVELKEAKRFANRGANLSQILIDNVVVIYIDALQNAEQIKTLIDSHIVQFDTC